MAKDLRSFLAQLQSRPDDLLTIERPVRPGEFEVTALLQQIEGKHPCPAVLFRNPIDLYGQPSPFPLFTNAYASRERCALMLDVDPATPHFAVGLAYGAKARGTIAPLVVSSNRAPVHETIWRGAEADVGRLPIVRHFEMDMGPTLTMTHVMRSVSGHYNVSFAKTFYKWDPRQMVVSLHTRDVVRILKEWEDRGEPAPIVNILGHHPAFHLGSLSRNPWGVDDYATLGSFLGEPLRLTPSVTWGDRFMVPADAELVIEGEIPPGKRDLCDPFGEVARLYQAQCLRPIFDTTAISFRRGAIMQDIFSGFRDSFPLGALLKEAALDAALRPSFPNLKEIHSPDSGCGVFAVYISVRGIEPGQAQEIGRIALETFGVVQCVVVVDDEIDVFDESQVLWAIHTYASFAKGFKTAGNWSASRAVAHVVAGGPQAGFSTTNWGGKVVVDATRPRDFAFGARSAVPQEVLDRMRLADFLPSAYAAGAR